MNHALIGALFPFTIAAILYVIRRGRASMKMLIIAPLGMIVCGLWAVAPDLPRLFGMQSLYLKLAADPRINICFWHYYIDQVETDSSWYSVWLFLMGMTVILVALRELSQQERA
ncbi:MAG: hypothetical protein WCO42_07165 [bacterium]